MTCNRGTCLLTHSLSTHLLSSSTHLLTYFLPNVRPVSLVIPLLTHPPNRRRVELARHRRVEARPFFDWLAHQPLQVLDHVLVVLLRRVHKCRAPNQVDGAQVGAHVGEELDDVLVPVSGRLWHGIVSDFYLMRLDGRSTTSRRGSSPALLSKRTTQPRSQGPPPGRPEWEGGVFCAHAGAPGVGMCARPRRLRPCQCRCAPSARVDPAAPRAQAAPARRAAPTPP